MRDFLIKKIVIFRSSRNKDTEETKNVAFSSFVSFIFLGSLGGLLVVVTRLRVAAIKNLLVGQPEVVRRVDVQAAHQTHLDVRHPAGFIKAETLNSAIGRHYLAPASSVPIQTHVTTVMNLVSVTQDSIA